jgi:hypothetical protein
MIPRPPSERERRAGAAMWGQRLAAAPSVKQTDRNGDPVIGDKGKPLYRNFVDFKDRTRSVYRAGCCPRSPRASGHRRRWG